MPMKENYAEEIYVAYPEVTSFLFEEKELISIIPFNKRITIMNLFSISTKISSVLCRTFFFLAFIGGLVCCKKGNSNDDKGPLAGGYSILVNKGNVLVSGFRAEGGNVNTKYWVNGDNSNQATFTGLVGNQSGYRQSVDKKSRTVYTYKNLDGTLQNYQFNQGSLANEGKIFYYKDNTMISMKGDNIGNISAVDFYSGRPYFGGFLGEITSSETGKVLRPITPFVWDGNSSFTLLSLPKNVLYFKGVSTIYASGSDEFYVGGFCGMPVYWKNEEPVVLDERYGEVWQITKSGSDVYAVGLINKYNSNSTGHTACYWKNGKLHELEDRAQAFGIYVDGDDIYVSGAVGNVPASYRPCYWKNGERVDLPM